VLAALLLATALVPTLAAFCAGLALRTTLAEPDYVMAVLRGERVVERVKTEFLDGLVGTVDLPPGERTALRTALDEGVRVKWLETQLQRILEGLAFYLSSDHEDLSVRLPMVELKIYVLTAVRRHMGDEAYFSLARGLEAIPDFVEVGPGLDLGLLERIRPYWRAAVLSPFVAGGAALLLSGLLWLAQGRGVRGLALPGGLWAAAGLVVVGSALSLTALTGQVLPLLVPLTVPELGSLPVHSVLAAAAEGVRSQLLAAGVGITIAGAFLLVSPRVVWERRGSPPEGRRHTVKGDGEEEAEAGGVK